MLISSKELYGAEIRGRDVLIGKLNDLYFAGEEWHIEKIMANAPDRRVAVPAGRIESVAVREQILNADLDAGQADRLADNGEIPAPGEEKAHEAGHLRSLWTLIGMHVAGSDERLGNIEDMIIETGTWKVRYAVVDTHDWLPGKKLLVEPALFERIHWREGRVYIEDRREAIVKRSHQHVLEESRTEKAAG